MTLAQLVTAPGQWLRADAAASWDRVAREVQRLHGWLPKITDSARPLATQIRIFLERYEPRVSGAGPFGDVRHWKGVRYVRVRSAAAAVPGTSWHGPGLAVDVSELGGFHGAKYAQLVAVMTRHGWTNAAGRTIDEPWHQQYYPWLDLHAGSGGGSTVTPAPTPPTSEEDTDMPLTDADVQKIWAHKPTGNSTMAQLVVALKQRVVDGHAPSKPLAEFAEVLTLLKGIPGKVWGLKPTGNSTFGQLLVRAKMRLDNGSAPEAAGLAEVAALRTEVLAELAAIRKTIEGKK